jgi:hypothetical protein
VKLLSSQRHTYSQHHNIWRVESSTIFLHTNILVVGPLRGIKNLQKVVAFRACCFGLHYNGLSMLKRNTKQQPTLAGRSPVSGCGGWSRQGCAVPAAQGKVPAIRSNGFVSLTGSVGLGDTHCGVTAQHHVAFSSGTGCNACASGPCDEACY